jgi:GMP synthase (glutamine-hydrolysing)
MKRILIVRTGSAPLSVRQQHGDMSDWFASSLSPQAESLVVDAEPGGLPDAGGFDGVLVTGSLKSVTQPEPWMESLGAWLLKTARSRPVLGVCFGHQLLARALGGRVERHPSGPEVGTTEVELTEAGQRDPLFAGLPARFAAQESHEDHVPELPPGSVLLARSAHAPVQAFAHGPRIRAVQFHPEFDALRNRAMLGAFRSKLDGIRPGLTSAALATLRDTPQASRVLANWLEGCGG